MKEALINYFKGTYVTRKLLNLKVHTLKFLFFTIIFFLLKTFNFVELLLSIRYERIIFPC